MSQRRAWDLVSLEDARGPQDAGELEQAEEANETNGAKHAHAFRSVGLKSKGKDPERADRKQVEREPGVAGTA